VFFMHSASAVDIYGAQRKHINYSICMANENFASRFETQIFTFISHRCRLSIHLESLFAAYKLYDVRINSLFSYSCMFSCFACRFIKLICFLFLFSPCFTKILFLIYAHNS
jgi:hypothetical protein